MRQDRTNLKRQLRKMARPSIAHFTNAEFGFSPGDSAAGDRGTSPGETGETDPGGGIPGTTYHKFVVGHPTYGKMSDDSTILWVL